MYLNPKTKRGQIFTQILNALCVFIPIAYGIAMLILPYAPGSTVGWFIEFNPIITSFFLAMTTFSSFLFLMTILLNIRRYIALATNEGNSGKISTALNILYLVILFASSLGTIALSLWGNDMLSSEFKGLCMSYAWLWCPLICFALYVALAVLSVLEKKGKEKNKFEVNIYRNPIFYAAVAIVIFAFLCIPVNHDRRAYEEDKNEYVYDRTNAFAYSFFKIEERDTKNIVGYKFVPFPLNYLDTDELFGVE